MSRPDPLSAHLLSEGLVTEGLLRTAQNRAHLRRMSVKDALIELGALSERELTLASSRVLRVPWVDLEESPILESVLRTIPEEKAREHVCVPIERKGNTLVLAMVDPSDIFAIDELKFLTGLNIEVVIACASAILGELDDYYSLGVRPLRTASR